MGSMRLNGFFLVLVFIFLALRESLAHTHKAVEQEIATDGDAFRVAAEGPQGLEEKNFNVVPSAAAEADEGKLGGRRMMAKKVVLKEDGMDGEAPKVSSANSPVGINSSHTRKEKLKTTRKLFSRSTHHPVKADMGSLMALSADYHVPKPHPPKNN